MNAKTFFTETFGAQHFRTDAPVLHQKNFNPSRKLMMAAGVLAVIILSNIGTYWYGGWKMSLASAEKQSLYLMEKASIYVTDPVLFLDFDTILT